MHIDAFARARQVELGPAKKALLAAALYRSAKALGRLDEKTVEDLFRLTLPAG